MKNICTVHIFEVIVRVHLLSKDLNQLHIAMVCCKMKCCKLFVCRTICPIFQVLESHSRVNTRRYVVAKAMIEENFETVRVMFEGGK